MDCNSVKTVVTDLNVSHCSSIDPVTNGAFDPRRWHRIEKDLCLHTAQHTAWLQIEQETETELPANKLVVTDVKVGEQPFSAGSDNQWESRPYGIWIRRSNYTGDSHQAVTGVDVLFGIDAVDPRHQWALLEAPLQLDAQPEVPVARLGVRHGRAKPRPDGPPPALRARKDGTFKIVQISDTHMVTGVGVCKDAIDAHGQLLPQSEADPLTIDFLEGILDVEKPDMVILTGDSLDGQFLDTQSVLFKLVAPMIERSIPWVAVFGNHDDEGPYTWSRTAQMSLLQDLPFSLCQPGPAHVDGVGNYYLQVLAPEPSQLSPLTLYLLDTHGEIKSKVRNPDYDWIKQSQIDWFTSTSQALRKARQEHNGHDRFPHLSLAFMHIPLPEYADSNLIVTGGHRREPTEAPSFNSHFYNALAKEGVVAVGCRHDHVNDFCGLQPGQPQKQHEESQPGGETPKLKGPWLCHAGGSGFGGYGSYGGKYYHRRARVWEIETTTGVIKTWKRAEYAGEKVDEMVLAESGAVVAPVLT